MAILLSDFEKQLIDAALQEIVEAGLFKWGYFYDDFESWFSEKRKTIPSVQRVDQGATKGVLVVREVYNYVIKFPLDFPDYCKIETENFLLAKARGLECFFAEEELYKEIEGFPFYIQVAVDAVDAYDELWVSASRSISKENYNGTFSYCIEVENILEKMDDGDRVRCLFKQSADLLLFLKENQINDLHSGNFGFIDGHPVIFDYSGF